jgi:hypothetical protein
MESTRKESHSAFGIFLLVLGLTSLAALGIAGWSYYTTPFDLRPFHKDYEMMKPSGVYSHGLGIIGSLMIIAGVALYSTRKRFRRFHSLGKVSGWLQVHIFLCLLGPILVLYHTTFKIGGVAAITLWTMLSVVASGIVGRFLYALIPRNLNGTEMTLEEIRQALSSTDSLLLSSPEGKALVSEIDDAFATVKKPSTIGEAISIFLRIRTIRAALGRRIDEILARPHIGTGDLHHIRRMAAKKAALLQRSLVLNQTERLFYYWHVIHLPFTVIMFITLAMHVVVVMLLGYRWLG